MYRKDFPIFRCRKMIVHLLTGVINVVFKTGKLIVALVAIMACGMPGVAAAQLGSSSIGTANVTVVIAPIGAAIGAARQGAVGLWSIAGGNQGLLVRAPTSLSLGDTGELRIFAQRADSIIVRDRASLSDIPIASSGVDRGLEWRDFNLRPTDAGGSQGFLISSL